MVTRPSSVPPSLHAELLILRELLQAQISNGNVHVIATQHVVSASPSPEFRVAKFNKNVGSNMLCRVRFATSISKRQFSETNSGTASTLPLLKCSYFFPLFSIEI